MQHLTETRVQNWRALGINNEGGEHLIYLGTSSEQVKKGYVTAFYELLTSDEQANMRRLVLERWHGVADSGRWVKQDFLKMPIPAVAAQAVAG